MRRTPFAIVPEVALPAGMAAGVPVPQVGSIRLGRRMILLSALSQNGAIGLMFGSFGTLIVEIERQMHVGRGLSTAGASLVILAIGTIAPFLGMLIRRFGIRALMMSGASLCAAGYAAAAFAPNILALLLCYALLVGPGIALLGLAVPNALVANWFTLGRGRAMGLVNMPIAVALVPPLMASLLPWLGLRGVYLLLAAFSVALVPALLWVIERPEHVGLHPHGHVAETDPPELPTPAGRLRLTRTADYWCLGLAAAIMGGGGATIATHIMPMAIGQGIVPAEAALLISVLGGAGIAGSVAYGMLADRIGGGRALAMNAFLQAILWCGLLVPMGFLPRLLLAGLIGLNAGGMITTLGTALSQRFGAAALGGALGLWSLMNLPFTVGMPPLAGVMYARTGSYRIAFAVQIGLFLVAVLLASIAARRAARLRERMEIGH